jgi:predicted acylesterase/phospholipase RssA
MGGSRGDARGRCGAAAHERMTNKEVVALVFQGGGALGAY